jgi:hypothetical protein
VCVCVCVPPPNPEVMRGFLQVSGDMRTGRIDFPRVYEDVMDRLRCCSAVLLRASVLKRAQGPGAVHWNQKVRRRGAGGVAPARLAAGSAAGVN